MFGTIGTIGKKIYFILIPQFEVVKGYGLLKYRDNVFQTHVESILHTGS